MQQHFYPSSQAGVGRIQRALVLIALWAILALVAVVGGLTIDLNHPFSLLDIESRALYVDEGFYADAAQNLRKFGQWDMPFDSRHWPGAPFMAAVQSMLFSVFGASITSARLLSICLSLISCAALYSISRTRFSPIVSLGITLSGLLTFNYVGFSRAAIADPTATSMSMLSLWAFVRVRTKSVAIPLSCFFAYCAFFSKMYFLFTVITMLFLWSAELLFVPMILRQAFDKHSIRVFIVTILAMLASYWIYQRIFHAEIANFLHINSNKTPHLDLTYLYYTFDDAIEKMPYHTKSPYLLGGLLLSIAYFFVTRLWPPKLLNIINDAQLLGRAEWAMGAFLACGFVVVGTLYLHKAHYHYFTILPVVFLSIAGINLIFRGRVKAALIALMLSLHLIIQIQYYDAWFSRPLLTSIDRASREMAELIDNEQRGEMIPVIGEYSAQLALYGARMMSLDAKWISQKALCERVDYWRPPYHVNVVWPGSQSRTERDKIAECASVSGYQELKRYSTFKAWKDEIVLSKINYRRDEDAR